MEKFDLIVLGGGPAGYSGAERAARGGLKTAVFEKRALGGVCLNEGCIPSKALLNSAKIYDHAVRGERYGVFVSGARVDQGAVVARKDKVVKALVSGIGMKLKKENVTVVEKSAVITGRSAEGFIVEADGESFAADRLLIATGSAPALLPVPGLREGLGSGFCLTNREILALTEIPDELVVIGGGVVGLEMASYFNSVGSKVTVIEMLPKIAGAMDGEVSELLLKEYRKRGVDFKLSCRVTAVGSDGVDYDDGGTPGRVSASKVLVSVGRWPLAAGIGLEKLGVYVDRGMIVTDANMRTNIAGVYAAGDVNGKSMLAHTAYREAEVAVNHMLGKRDTMRYSAVPSVIYTDPEAACVGETLESARQKGLEVREIKVPMRMSGRYMAEVDAGGGIAKIVVDTANDRLVGVHLLGSYASEIIYGAALMLETELSPDALKELVFPHPTVGEVIREALFEL